MWWRFSKVLLGKIIPPAQLNFFVDVAINLSTYDLAACFSQHQWDFPVATHSIVYFLIQSDIIFSSSPYSWNYLLNNIGHLIFLTIFEALILAIERFQPGPQKIQKTWGFSRLRDKQLINVKLGGLDFPVWRYTVRTITWNHEAWSLTLIWDFLVNVTAGLFPTVQLNTKGTSQWCNIFGIRYFHDI